VPFDLGQPGLNTLSYYEIVNFFFSKSVVMSYHLTMTYSTETYYEYGIRKADINYVLCFVPTILGAD
jgi:hypothetical protein